MNKEIFKIMDELDELRLTVSMLGVMQAAYSTDNTISDRETSGALWLLYCKQSDILGKMKGIVDRYREQEGVKNE